MATTTVLPATLAPPAPLPGPVTGLVSSAGGGSGEISLTWDQDPDPAVVAYVVTEASAPSGPFVDISTVDRATVERFVTTRVPFTDSDNSGPRWYRVRAPDSTGRRGQVGETVCDAPVGAACP